MKRKHTTIFYFQKDNQGGVLFPVLAILFMFTLLLIYVTDDYFSRREMLVNTKDYYIVRKMEELSMLEVDEKDKESTRTFYFNNGQSVWKWDPNSKNFLVKTSLSNQYKRTSNQELTTKR